MKRLFALYAWLGPLLLTPLACYLWHRQSHSWRITAIAVAVPIIHAYIVPAIGTNLLKVWGFSSRVRIGQFRPQHGFVFGSATAALTGLLFALLGPDADATQRVLATGALLLAVNWFYDALAIRHGILLVRNQPWANGAGPSAIAGDYVVWFFGLFGLIYAALVDRALHRPAPDPLVWIAGGAALTMVLPTLCYIAMSYLRHGHSGCRPITRGVA